MTNQPSPAEVAASIVDGLRADWRARHVADADFDAELARRIAHAIEGERDMARQWFDYYAIPEPDDALRAGGGEG